MTSGKIDSFWGGYCEFQAPAIHVPDVSVTGDLIPSLALFCELPAQPRPLRSWFPLLPAPLLAMILTYIRGC